MPSSKMNWLLVAGKWQLDELLPIQNKVVTIKVNGKAYCIGRVGSEYFAVNNKCPHAGGPLGEGQCDADGNVTCPFHRYKFSLKTGMMVNGQGYYVDTFPLELREDGLYIGLRKKWLGIF